MATGFDERTYRRRNEAERTYAGALGVEVDEATGIPMMPTWPISD